MVGQSLIRAWLLCCCVVLLLFFGASLKAASLRITPVIIDQTAPAKSGSIAVTNISDEPVTLQIRAFRWSQENGQEHISETRDVIASPPLARLNPGETYTLRVLRVVAKPVTGEESYRLILDEVPKPIDPSAAGQNVRIVLRSSLPVFFAQQGSRPDLDFKAWTENGRAILEVHNKGTRYAKLVGMRLVADGKTLALASAQNGYVLAGKTIRFESQGETPAILAGSGSRLSAELISGPGSSLEVRQTVVLERR